MLSIRTALAVTVAVLLLFGQSASAPSTTQAAYPGIANGKIVVSRGSPGNMDLYLMNADGTGLTRLTDSPYEDRDPAWSPAGQFILFERHQSATSGGDIYLIRADGTGLTHVNFEEPWEPPTFRDDIDPTWKPDAEFLAFSANGQGQYKVMVSTFLPFVIGSIEEGRPNTGNSVEPAWAPDGQRYAFSSDRNGRWELFVVERYQDAVTQLTDNSGATPVSTADSNPAWSPDGARIAFARQVAGRSEIWTIPVPGGTPTRFTHGPGDHRHPAYSPDGTKLLWAATIDGLSQLVLADVASGDASAMTIIADGPTYADPDWQPVLAYPAADARFSEFEADIAWLYETGITHGCSPELFCTRGRVTRAQMASFLARALNLPPTSVDYFPDDEGNKHEDNINRLAAAGITHGCGDGTRFCPAGRVTRAQMASFLARALKLPATDVDYFRDDDWSRHESNINRIAEAGITHGCHPGEFCPTGLVLREQMAAFLHRALVE